MNWVAAGEGLERRKPAAPLLRKVRAPQGMMPGNTRARGAKAPCDSERNRKYTA
ncbi:hypothetical protein FACS1894141_2900 [Spirochaetia bacterium]|nr:hypothetical protein FACS1894141_2900 [Spirochaetia bacterium]